MATYTLISSNVLSSSAASVTFSSIPATYTDLVLRISTRGDNTGDLQHWITFNGVSTTTYSATWMYGTGAAANSTSVLDNERLRAGYRNSDSTTSNTFASTEIYIPNYTVSANKPISVFGATENNAASDRTFVSAWAGLWRNTAAITSIAIASSSGNYVSGSSFYLYGISNA